MKLLQNSSGNHLGLQPQEALELIAQLAEAVKNHDKQGGSGFVLPLIQNVSPTVGGKDNRDFPSTIHIFVEKGYK